MLKNAYARTKNVKSTPIEKIQQILLAHRARSVAFEYGNDGRVMGLTFSFMINGREFGYKMPARIEKVEKILGRGHGDPQAYTTAWANIRDWIDSQLALVETEMVKIEEVFLPYMINNKGKTFFEQMAGNNFQLESGPIEGEVME